MGVAFTPDYAAPVGDTNGCHNNGGGAFEAADAALTKNAVAPAEAVGMDKFDGMFKRDSPDVAWRVAFKTMRKSRIGDGRLPCGFPQLWTFFHEARSLRVFQWGFYKYQELYNEGTGWNQWVGHPNSVGEWHPQKLRSSIWMHCDRAQRGIMKESTKKPYKVTDVQRKIIMWTIGAGLWDNVPIEAAPSKIRALRNWARARRSLRAAAIVQYISGQAKAKKLASKRSRSPSLCIVPDSDSGSHARIGCVSPSLKRVCV